MPSQPLSGKMAFIRETLNKATDEQADAFLQCNALGSVASSLVMAMPIEARLEWLKQMDASGAFKE